MNPPALVAFAALCVCLPAIAVAQVQSATRVDDSGTVVGKPLVTMQWRHPVPGRGASDEVDGDVDVALRLNLAPWLNREVRLYLVLEPSPVQGAFVTARWQASGRLLPGAVRSGSRVLVFQGRVTDRVMQERLRFTLTTDGGRLAGTQSLQFHIEAEAR